MSSLSRTRCDTLMEATKFPKLEGTLLRRGFFNDWQKRHVELENNIIIISMVRGGMGYITFKLSAKTRCEDSSIRHFCFTLTNPDGESLFFAAENVASKEAWTEAIQSTLSLLRLASRKNKAMSRGHHVTGEQAINDYHSRPQIFIKVIQARNLTGKDNNGFSDPYVKISLGSSTVVTTTRKKNLNPDWGMVFPFDWDRSMRFAKVEVWDEDDISAHDFLGTVLIPLYTLRDGDSYVKWYPLGKRSTKSNISGEIELEIACTGQPDREQNAWHLFQSIQALPQMSLNLASKVDGSGQITLKYLYDGVSRNPPKQLEASTTGSASEPSTPTPVTPAVNSDNTTTESEDSNTMTTVDCELVTIASAAANTAEFAASIAPVSKTTPTITPTNTTPVNYISIDADLDSTADNNNNISNSSSYINGTSGVVAPRRGSSMLALDAQPTYQSHNLITPTRRTSNFNHNSNNNDSSASQPPVLHGFPLRYPPIETESLEDMSLRASISCMVNATKVMCPGVLFLTNYRIIFVSLTHMFRKPECYETVNPNIFSSANTPDLTTYIPLSSIMSVALTTENEGSGFGPLSSSYDAIRVKTSDGRVISFMFKDDVDALSNYKDPAKVIINKMADIIVNSEGAIANLKHSIDNYNPLKNASVDIPFLHSTSSKSRMDSSAHDSKEGNIPTFDSIYSSKDDTLSERHNSVTFEKHSSVTLSQLVERQSSASTSNASTSTKQDIQSKIKHHAAKKLSAYNYYNTYGDDGTGEEGMLSTERCLMAVCKENSAKVEASESAEGPPAHRIYLRLKLTVINRLSQRHEALSVHKPLLNALARACGQAPSEEMTPSGMQQSIGNAIGIDHNGRLVSAEELADLPSDSDAGFSYNPVHPALLPMGWVSNQDGSTGADNAQQAPLTEKDKLQRECTVRGLETKIKKNDDLVHTANFLLVNLENSWDRFVPMAEFARMGVPNKNWRISHANADYKLCPTYPAILAVPDQILDSELAGAATFRSKGRIPTLSWHSVKNGCTISRCSQPLIGLTNSRCPEDEHILSAANRAAQQTTVIEANGSEKVIPNKIIRPYIIADARPLLNARANQAAGKGVESDKVYENVSVVFMDIANIHAVRKSLEVLEEACADEASWMRNLESSGWLGHIRKILLAVGRITHCVAHEHLSVLVHCSDGWDRTSQLTSLSMLMLDDYYRTLDGFIVLIEKEWLSFGHKFGDRLGYTSDGWKDEERSPIFAQFLDCVHQCLVQMPNAFEFNQELLLFLMEHINSGWFGNFFFNTEQELKYYSSHGALISIWSVVLGNRENFLNPGYYMHESPLIPVVTKSRLVVWSAWFLRWHDTIWSVSWADTQQVDLGKLAGSTSGAWVDNHSVKECQCGRTFRWYRRKHHCRCCGNIFCEACSRELRVIPSVSTWRPSRCCAECARLIDLSESEVVPMRTPSRRMTTFLASTPADDEADAEEN